MKVTNTQLVVSQHAFNEISQGTPEVLAASKIMLVDKENIVLEAGVEMGFEAKLTNYGIVMAVYMGVNAVHTFKHLTDHAGEGLGEWNTWIRSVTSSVFWVGSWVGKGLLPILLGNTASLSILLWTQPIKCSIYVGAGILVGRLKFSESCHKYSNLGMLAKTTHSQDGSYSSVAFMSGHDTGEQNSVIDP